jgi:hypothetical protein
MHQPFVLRVANYGSKPIHLQKHRVMGHATGVPDRVYTISDINLDRMEQKVTSPEDESWKDNLDMNHLPEQAQHKVKTMLSKHSTMWTGQLGQIAITQHRIDLVPDSKPVYQAPYRAGVKGREVEKEEVERMLKAVIIEPARNGLVPPF